jgi:hypothetical protein
VDPRAVCDGASSTVSATFRQGRMRERSGLQSCNNAEKISTLAHANAYPARSVPASLCCVLALLALPRCRDAVARSIGCIARAGEARSTGLSLRVVGDRRAVCGRARSQGPAVGALVRIIDRPARWPGRGGQRAAQGGGSKNGSQLHAADVSHSRRRTVAPCCCMDHSPSAGLSPLPLQHGCRHDSAARGAVHASICANATLVAPLPNLRRIDPRIGPVFP